MSRTECPCGQTFSIPPDAGPRTWSCYACGRKLSLTSDGRILELAVPKDSREQGPTDRARLPEAPQPAPAKPALVCAACGIEVYATCAWCGEAHCWLHAPHGQPRGLGAPAHDDALARFSRWPWLIYLAPLAVYLAWILIRVLLDD